MDAVSALVLNLVLFFVAMYVLYVVVRKAVRDGMGDAWARRDASQTGATDATD